MVTVKELNDAAQKVEDSYNIHESCHEEKAFNVEILIGLVHQYYLENWEPPLNENKKNK